METWSWQNLLISLCEVAKNQLQKESFMAHSMRSITRVMQEAEKAEEIDKNEKDSQIEIDLGESNNETEE